MSNPLETLIRGFAWGTGRRAANRVPLWLGIVIVILLTVLGGK